MISRADMASQAAWVSFKLLEPIHRAVAGRNMLKEKDDGNPDI
jgi:hypothetical protein